MLSFYYYYYFVKKRGRKRIINSDSNEIDENNAGNEKKTFALKTIEVLIIKT